MADEALVRRAAQLRQRINYHNHRYHVLDSPVVSDAEFDQLVRELQALENEHPELRTSDSPTQRVGGQPGERFTRVAHPKPILSLGNAFDADEVRAWYERICKIDPRVGEADFTVEPKLDGLTVVLHYQDGVFSLGTTRGDGENGEDITANLRTVKSLPLRVPVEPGGPAAPARLVVRGEAIIFKKDFEEMNRKLEAAGERTYVNPRNTAAGSLRQLDPALTAVRPIRLFCYAIVDGEGDLPVRQWNVLRYLEDLGFPVNRDSARCDGIEEAIRWVEAFGKRRQSLDYETDGVVIKLNDLRLSESLGFVGKDPRGAIAFKYPAQVVTTQLLDIGTKVGRTGVITPYAILAPVDVGGVTVRQATLHNFDFILEKDIRIGDRVFVKRAGEVIPYVIGPVTDVRSGDERPYDLPTICPSCGESLERIPGEVAVYCVNAACPAQLVRNVEHFASRGAMDVEGLGIKVAEQLVEAGLVGDVADVYSLKMADLLKLEGFGEKKAEKLLLAIDKSRTQTLSRLISALGIHGVGEALASELAANFQDLDELSSTSMEILESIGGIGPNIARALSEWFLNKRNQQILAKLKSAGTWPRSEGSAQETGRRPLAGLTFVITGRLPTWSRNEAKELIQRHGGKVSSSISKRTDYLLVGEDPGSKADKARALGVPQIDQEGLLKLVGQQPGQNDSPDLD